MKRLLVYGDSMSWGLIPGTRERLTFQERWPGVLENTLNRQAPLVRVIENCLNGRRTVWEDPFKPGRNGLTGVQQVMEINAPLDLVILLLGVNDFQAVHTSMAIQVAQGITAVIQSMRSAPIEPGMPVAPLLLVAPPPISQAKGAMADKFINAEQKSLGLSERYAEVARELNCHFFEAGKVVSTSAVDGVHLDKTEHLLLGQALAEQCRDILSL